MKVVLIILTMVILQSCSTARAITATSNPIAKKSGTACAANILGIIPLSLDSSIYTAAKNGGIQKISTVDYTGFHSIFYNKNCTTVHGSN